MKNQISESKRKAEGEKGTINRILDNIIKRILINGTNIHTKREPIYRNRNKRHSHMTHRRINMLCRLETTNSNMITSILEIETEQGKQIKSQIPSNQYQG